MENILKKLIRRFSMACKQFEITGKCNLSCRACYNKYLMESLGDIEIKSVLKHVSAGDIVYLGGGEPMIHPGIQKLVEKLVNIPTEVVIATNAILYKKMPQQAQIQISVWTLNPSLFNQILGGTGRQLRKVKKNIGLYSRKNIIYSKNKQPVERYYLKC